MRDFPENGWAPPASTPCPDPVLVLQTGARHGYAIPKILAEAGCLERLETTAAFSKEQARMPGIPRRLAEAMDRRRPDLPAALWQGHVLPDLLRQGATWFGAGTIAGREIQNRCLGRQVARRGPGSARIALSIDGAGGAACLARLKDQGLKIVVDIAVTPLAADAMAEAQAAAPDWVSGRLSVRDVRRFRERYAGLAAMADLILAPSPAVARALTSAFGVHPDQIAHAPYPLALQPPAASRPEPGRILFVGSDALRKGLPNLAQAVASLRQSGLNARLLVAGRLSSRIARHPALQDAELLGHIGPAALSAQLARADLFALPSRAEGFPAAVVEAMAAGLPAVVTPESGAPVTDGKTGAVVPLDHPGALAEALATIIRDRPMREQMSAAARATAACYTSKSLRLAWLTALATVSTQ